MEKKWTIVKQPDKIYPDSSPETKTRRNKKKKGRNLDVHLNKMFATDF